MFFQPCVSKHNGYGQSISRPNPNSSDSYMHVTAAVHLPSGRHTPKSNAQADITTGMTSADATAAGDQASGVAQNSSGFMGMRSGVGAAAHKGSPHKAAEMLSMSQSPTAEKVGASKCTVGIAF